MGPGGHSLVEGLSVLLNTGGWALAFPGGERPVGAARLVAVRLAGDAVSSALTPSATIGGELLARALAGAAHVLERPVGIGERHKGRAVAGPGGLHPARDRDRLPGLAAGREWVGWRAAIVVASLAGAMAVAPWAGFVWAVDHGFWTAIQGALGRRCASAGPRRSRGAAPGGVADATSRAGGRKAGVRRRSAVFARRAERVGALEII